MPTTKSILTKTEWAIVVVLVVVLGGVILFFGMWARESYTIRSIIRYEVGTAAETRQAIEAQVRKGYTLGTLPAYSENTRTAGSHSSRSKYVSGIAYDQDGVVTITLADHKYLGTARNKTLIYVPTPHDGRLAWELSDNSTVPPKYRPKLSAWWPQPFAAKRRATERGTDRKTVVAELGEPKTTTTTLVLSEFNGEGSNYQRLPETVYYLVWEYQAGMFVIGFDENDRSTEKLFFPAY